MGAVPDRNIVLDDDNANDIVDEPSAKTLYLTFKWDRIKMKTKKDLDTKHMLYLLHLALERVRERTIDRNRQFKNYGRNDRVLKHPDYTQIITNLIDWHLMDPKKNKFDGPSLANMQRIEFTNRIKKV